MEFAELPETAMRALLDDDLDRASNVTGVALTAYFLTDDAKGLWAYRLAQLARDPAHAPWIVRAAIADGAVVGHAGYQGAPDENGTVEIAYSVDPAHRRRGHAATMLAALLERAAAEPSVRTVRASISPDNVGSLATIAGHGFAYIGEQWDEEDGRELVFERPAN